MQPSSEQTIRDLQNELEQTRSSVICMMPFEAQLILMSYDSCKTRVETYQWPDAVARKLSELAEILPPTIFDSSDRAYCPLCGDGSSWAYQEGFRLPEGLRRHLVGWGDRQACPVFTIALRLAREDWDKRFHAAEERAKAKILKRRKCETLYKVGPTHSPELLDAGTYFCGRARNLAELVWAETRLSNLGFLITTEARVRSYIDERDQFVVYADPRRHGLIMLMVYAKPIPNQDHLRSIATFNLSDNWKNDIRGKYEARLPHR